MIARTVPLSRNYQFMSLLLIVALGAAQATAPAQAVAVAPDSAAPATTPVDTAIIAATVALQRGLPWRASAILAPMVADRGARPPAAVLLAATAASRWRGWREVRDLLSGESWLDTLGGGEGRRLLARSAFELGDDSAAVRDAAAAADESRAPGVRAQALVVLARALERLDARDSAAATYIRAAPMVPDAADWLRLRAASLTADSAVRAQLYGGLSSPAAQARIGRAEALLRQRLGDRLGAAAKLDSLGARAVALELRLQASDSDGLVALRPRALALAKDGGPDERRRAIVLLDSVFAPLAAEEALVVARAAAETGLTDRAVSAFEQAFAAKLGDRADRFAYGNALFRLARYPDAAKAFARIPARDPRGGAAAYQRARSLLRAGENAQAAAALRTVLVKFPKDTLAAAPALVLLADLAADQRQDSLARRLQLRLARAFPAHRFTPPARLRAAVIALIQGAADTAAMELDALAADRRAAAETLAALYWSGRAWAALGDSSRARERWESVRGRDPASYYAWLSELRLGLPRWEPPAAADSFEAAPDIEQGLDRAAELDRLGLAAEAQAERDWIVRFADGPPERMLAIAAALRRHGLASQASRLATRALGRGAIADSRLYRLLYPVLHADAIRAEASAHRLDPAFVAALIRQESLFNPTATSSAGARGLMQLMPATGGLLARSLAFPTWDPVLLWQPDVSIVMGTRHLAELAARYGDPVRVLAAYNAGIHRVTLWDEKPGVADPEIFAEQIPFVETRDYVRIIQRNRELYRSLYDWGSPAQ
ncbi:MAG TPA: lytic transglycosylase domain-containing protein [Gemmatimonadales bacterium]|nr:lytic transglycosylase domain-containing protein [Gemmatimonadales bacterium]